MNPPASPRQCPVSWCDREHDEHDDAGTHTGTRYSAYGESHSADVHDWYQRNVIVRVVQEGALEDTSTLSIQLFDERGGKLSSRLTWQQVRKLREALDLAEREHLSHQNGQAAPGD